MKTIRQHIFRLFIVSLFPISVFAGTDTLTKPYPSPELKRMSNDIVRLSADEMEGREPGTAGEKLAYEYIIRELYSAGVAPAGKDGFLQPFTFNAGYYAGTNNKLRIGKVELEMKKDFFPCLRILIPIQSFLPMRRSVRELIVRRRGVLQ